MNEEYGLDFDDIDGGEDYDWLDGDVVEDFFEEDVKFLFKDLFDDYWINFYSLWEKLMEDGVIIDDLWYIVFLIIKVCKECWSEWLWECIVEFKE